MSRRTKPIRLGALVAVAVMASLWLPQAAAQGRTVVPQAARQPAAGHAPNGIDLATVPWLRGALGTATASPAGAAGVTTGNFSSCPKLPAGYSRAEFTCFIIHITGGKLQMGRADQTINRNIVISYAEGTDPQGALTIVFGSMRSRPMPASGGIFLKPSVDWYTKHHPYLQLSVKPRGLGASPDTSGAGTGFISMRIKAINPVFGSKCFIGTGQDPITVDPTFGTTNPPPPNKPIHGHIKSVKQTRVETITIGTVVDNAFAAPAATGCGPMDQLASDGELTKVVNEVGGLPSPAGTNTAIFRVTVELVPYQHLKS